MIYKYHIYDTNISCIRNRSHVNASMALTRAGHLCLYNYITSLLNIILRPILMVWTWLEP